MRIHQDHSSSGSRAHRVYKSHWLILFCQNRQTPNRHNPKRSLPTPSRSSSSHETPTSTYSSIEIKRAGFSDAPQPQAAVQQSHDTQSNRAASAPPLRPELESPSNERGAEFHGENSFKSILKEHLGSMGVVSTELDSSQTKETSIDKDRVAQGAQILTFMSNRRMINAFVSLWFEITDGSGLVSAEPVVKAWMRKLWLCHGDVLEKQDPEELLQLSGLLWRNTQTTISISGSTTATEWTDLAAGQNIRWEVIGIIAAIVGMCGAYGETNHPLFKEHGVTRLTLPKQAHRVAETCLDFCRECDVIDDLFLFLIVETMGLTSDIRGDNSYSTYCLVGEVVSAVVSLGYHQKIEANERVPFFLSELRKRARSCAYFSETSVSSFLGRPPRASNRYWHLDPPLDLTDNQLVLDKTEMESAIAALDKDGFNKVGNVTRSTFTRTWSGFAQRREDILDLALGSYSRGEIIDRAEVIQQKTEEHWKRLPEFLQKIRYDRLDSTLKHMKLLYMTILCQASRANELLLQRVLIRKTGSSNEKLVRIAQTIFADVLELGSRHDMFPTFHVDITAILVLHGLRASAIIAVELLKQEQHPVYPKEPLLPRSQTIQDLSVFAARLGIVDKAEGMYHLCQQGQKIITRILDKILSPPKPVDQHVQAQTPDLTEFQNQQQLPYGQMELDMVGNCMFQGGTSYVPYMGPAAPMDFNFGQPYPTAQENESMFMSWLDSVDWERQGPLVGM
ncbi:hypothetical protein JX265_003220 [Neoarthrinium moseri]|uniref:Xylanolytic transcriptional activator regulatory domain-containing protein n=1 Tax=Neoarthrinium moseri TaxID=1658444 RepID=A0A9Q0ASM6_9PEZI|nr:uncharacterized protein JN550_005541 [Neoarthrinium moseri]KAI1852732.1 hypothetical protein JX266_002273 [Neoarthrinium moseri]KAI1869951.1 hypothetical protein JN550_005541 [Neoarthrinium moseri]KAI1879043.1 hypothetical protein JX265_003220 [Neoarthrinium moseri]